MKNRILICDDDESILEVIRIILEEEGYEVKAVNNCFNIEEIISVYDPEIILLDLWMKNYDGRDIAKKIKKIDKYKETPILFISALNDLESIAKESKVTDFIRKPFEMNDLIEKVGKYVKREEV